MSPISRSRDWTVPGVLANRNISRSLFRKAFRIDIFTPVVDPCSYNGYPGYEVCIRQIRMSLEFRIKDESVEPSVDNMPFPMSYRLDGPDSERERPQSSDSG